MENTPGMASADILRNIEESKRNQENRERIINEKSRKLEEERRALQKYVHNNANPEPIMILSVSIAVLLMLWIIYLIFLKPVITGEWYDDLGNKWELEHNVITGKLKVKLNGMCAGAGKVVDNFVRYGDLIGVWDYYNNIIFTEGLVLHRVL